MTEMIGSFFNVDDDMSCKKQRIRRTGISLKGMQPDE
jgi:hypothetical protein